MRVPAPIFGLLVTALAGCSGDGPDKEQEDAGVADTSSDDDAATSSEATFHERDTFELSLEPRAPIATDLDGDGHLDLVVVHQFSAEVRIFMGNGSGWFAEEPAMTVERATAATVADLDGDDARDLVISVEGEPRLTIVHDLTDTAATTDLDVAAAPHGVIATDADGDGDRDLAVSVAGNLSEPTTRVALFTNDEEVFTGPATFEVGFRPTEMIVGDVDDDGDEDLGVLLGTTSAVVLQADGTGGYAASAPFASGDGVLHATFLDVDASGGLDIVFADLTADALTVALDVPGDDADELTPIDTPFDVATATLNDDTVPDLVVSSVDDATVRGLSSTPEGTYRPVKLAEIEDAVRLGGLATGDFDEDGIDDVAVVQRGRDSDPGALHVFTSNPAPMR